MRLEGKIAVITGAARGMGADEAELFAQEAATVLIADLLESEGQNVARNIEETGGRALFLKHDVTSEESWNKIVDVAIQKFGKIDILVNNAGIANRGSFQSTSLESWTRTMAVNATGVFLGMRTLYPVMKQSNGGAIVNISSSSGVAAAKYPNPETMPNAAYYASKAAVRLLTKLAAVQYGPHGIRVNTVCPGFIQTPLTKESLEDPDRFEYFKSVIPMPRFGRERDVAQAVLYLASDDSSFVNGAELIVDGGYLAKS